ncbi:MAG TPA: TonB-dependent receptor, partial [Chitinophagaceae bacterium]
MKKRILSMIITSCLWVFVGHAQLTISGKISRGSSDEPVAGATIKVKDAATGVIADSMGQFRLVVAALPVTLIISHTSYKETEVKVFKRTMNYVELEPKYQSLGDVTFRPPKGAVSRVLNHTATVSVIGQNLIKNSASPDTYGIIPTQLGFEKNTSGLLMTTPSSRGFNGSGSTRVNQFTDNMDGQAPGLNFFIGNFVGLTELDFESIELLPGASSALYGPGGMNGTILINSKNPFKHQGLSIMVKQGFMNVDEKKRPLSSYNDYSLRWAKAFNNKFAFKIGLQYLSANDWLAGDSTDYIREGTSGKLVGGTRQTDPNYDGVNVYGDETSQDAEAIAKIMENMGVIPPGSSELLRGQFVSRTGYHERDIIDPETKNIKLNGALHYKIKDNLEAILLAKWSTGNTVYTDDNRYSLKGIKLAQYKAELRSKRWFLRSYTTQEDAGEAHSATITAQYFNEAWKPSGQWYPQYIGAYVQAVKLLGYSSAMAHMFARNYADAGRPQAGSAQFNHLFDSVRKVPISMRGGLFKERSQLWMHEGQYTFG